MLITSCFLTARNLTFLCDFPSSLLHCFRTGWACHYLAKTRPKGSGEEVWSLHLYRGGHSVVSNSGVNSPYANMIHACSLIRSVFVPFIIVMIWTCLMIYHTDIVSMIHVFLQKSICYLHTMNRKLSRQETPNSVKTKCNICDHSMWALYVWPLYGSTLCVATQIVTTLWEHSMCGHSMWALYVGPFYVSTLCVATLCVTTLCEHSMCGHSMCDHSMGVLLMCGHSMWALYVWSFYVSTLCVQHSMRDHSMCDHSMWALYASPLYVSRKVRKLPRKLDFSSWAGCCSAKNVKKTRVLL